MSVRRATFNYVFDVSGPNSIAKSVVEPDNGGRYMVYYTPVEVGLYNISIKWNGKEIEGIECCLFVIRKMLLLFGAKRQY